MKPIPEWHEKISQPVHEQISTELDVTIPMRDGVLLSADVHRPDAEGQFPALIAFQPWGKDHDAFGLHFPRQRRPSPLWDGALESGDTRYLVARGYVHIIVDARGTGHSGGELTGVFGAGGKGEGQDIHDIVEWLAEQPWCDGNVGMVGISYLAAVQLLAAAEQPPHLKAIFPEGGHYDTYRHVYHGGILWQMPRAAMRGRGGDSGMAVANPFSFTRRRVGDEKFNALLEQKLRDPDIHYHPNYHQLLRYPELDPIWLDYIINDVDGWFWQGEGTLEERLAKVEIPVHLGVQIGRGWQMDETIHAFNGLNVPKQIAIRPGPPMQERPFNEFHDEIVRWYDHWLKGNDTGMLDEPPIQVHVQGSNEVRYFDQWPVPETQWTKLFLRPGGRLTQDPEGLDALDAPPDGYYQAPERVTSQVSRLVYETLAFEQDVDLIGPAALNLWAEIDTDDTNWILTVSDVAPDGSEMKMTTGWLKASHREVYEGLSEPWAPYHPHTRAVPVPAGEVIEYAIRVYPMTHRVRTGHRLRLEIKSTEAEQSVDVMLPPESAHLNSGRATTHKVYRDRDQPSHLILPVVPTERKDQG
ncbi:MAG TPA: CocE/NonD family hydrolase [Solirubrobacteraceae bacterium]|jgi:hypothetical protein|nr:CocE/NonD family hydrolase [Solirubrobacteraceae bacterium]